MRTGTWRPASPASELSLQRLREGCSVSLPAEYLDLLAESNGGEGDLGLEPMWISFWPAEEVLSLNADYEVAQCLPGFFGFASNGGGELIAFDMRGKAPNPIVMVPFIPMRFDHVVQICSSFEELKKLIGTEYDEPPNMAFARLACSYEVGTLVRG
jgi:hypothetical protein